MSSAHENHSPVILIVDDDWMNREMMEAHLSAASYRVCTAHNGEKALELAAKTPPDLVLLDIRMPDMNGYEVCRRLKNNQATRFTPVVMVTALQTDDDKLEAVEAGADDFLTKPFSSIMLLTRVKSLLRIKNLHDELEDRNRLLRRVLSQYMDEDTAHGSPSDSEPHLKLGGETRKITVCFADIRGFTSYAERRPAHAVLDTLNYIFAGLTEVVFEHGGTLDKYIGDELMAFFGAPVTTEHDTRNALKMALHLQHEFRRIATSIPEHGLEQLALGIGLHTGEAAVGNVGSARTMSYTVIGNTVNIAQRMQRIATPGQTLISEAVYDEAKAYITAQQLDTHTLESRGRSIILYELRDVLG